MKKSVPPRVDMAKPQQNFANAGFVAPTDIRKPSGFRHGIGQRAGKLRISGKPGAHRIGKR